MPVFRCAGSAGGDAVNGLPDQFSGNRIDNIECIAGAVGGTDQRRAAQILVFVIAARKNHDRDRFFRAAAIEIDSGHLRLAPGLAELGEVGIGAANAPQQFRRGRRGDVDGVIGIAAATQAEIQHGTVACIIADGA